MRAAREHEEAGRRRTLEGEGQEFVGYRPYRAGEDLRALDWELLARLDRPFVRVHRSEAREDWWVGIDASASMGVGTGGKLQSAAEAAAATLAVGLRFGAHVTLAWTDAGGAFRRFTARRAPDLAPALAALEGLVVNSGPGGGLEGLLDRGRGPARRRAGRLILLGDLLDVDLRAVLGLLGGRRRIHLGQILAPEEWDPSLVLSGRRAVSWVDPETGARTASDEDAVALTRYARQLEDFVERWSSLARTHRMVHHVWSAGDPFESHLKELLR